MPPENTFVYDTFTAGGSVDRALWLGLTDQAVPNTRARDEDGEVERPTVCPGVQVPTMGQAKARVGSLYDSGSGGWGGGGWGGAAWMPGRTLNLIRSCSMPLTRTINT